MRQYWADGVGVRAGSWCHFLTMTSDYWNLILSQQAGVEVCLQLGKLGMGRDALLAAILGGVLRPKTSKEHSTHPGFGRAPVTLVDIREGFGKNVARLVAGLEHVTCVEETAHTVLRGTAGSARDRNRSLSAPGSWGLENTGGGVSMAEDEESEPLSPAMLVGVREGLPSGTVRGGVREAKARSLREASALEQVSSVESEVKTKVLFSAYFCLRSPGRVLGGTRGGRFPKFAAIRESLMLLFHVSLGYGTRKSGYFRLFPC